MADAGGPTTIIYDPHGDRKILAGSEEKPATFIVSSQAMSLTSRQWRVMFAADSPFASAPGATDSVIEVPMPDDDVKSLKILLSVIHLKFKLVPTVLAYEDLVSLAILTDKYDVAEVVQPWITNWVNKHVIPRGLQDLSSLANSEGWLFVAWSFGLVDVFEQIWAVLVKNIAISKDYTLTMLDHVIRSDRLPPGVLGTHSFFNEPCFRLLDADSIVEAREHLLGDLLNTCYDQVDRFTNITEGQTICNWGANEKECDACSIGSLLQSLQRCKL